MESIRINVSGAELTLTTYEDGTFMIEKNEGGKWFVSSQDLEKTFWLQENLKDGGIRDISKQKNLVSALHAIAWAQ